MHAELRKTDYPIGSEAPQPRTTDDPVGVQELFTGLKSSLKPNPFQEEKISWMGFGHPELLVPQNGVMSKLGAAATHATALFLEADPNFKATLDVRLDGCGYRMYSTMLLRHKPSNWVRFNGRNADTGVRASFDFSAMPTSPSAIASVEVKIGTPQDDGSLHVVHDQLVCVSEDTVAYDRSVYESVRGENSAPEKLGRHEALWDTCIAEMIKKAADGLTGRGVEV